MIRPPCCALLVAAAACTGGGAPPALLTLEGVRPAAAEGVFLNEELVFHFSEALDPASVTSASVRITPEGVPGAPQARGRLALAGRALVFTPDPVLAFDLSNGGYLPGTTYTVELAGFPRPEGLRAKSGAPLAASALYRFTTVEAREPGEPREGLVFEDPSPGRGTPVVLRSEIVSPGEPILLEGGEPLDPSTLYAADFVLHPGPPRSRTELGAPIPLRARMADNRDRSAGAGTALVELYPMERLQAGSTYQLMVDEELLRLRDFGGHRVIVRTTKGRTQLEIRVEAPSGGPAQAYLEHTETFMDARLRSPEPVPGADGTIQWTDTGRAEVRWPRAAGDGHAGPVELSARFLEADLQATALVLPAGRSCQLSPVSGLVVLRAQGRLDLYGRLERHSGKGFGRKARLPFVLEARDRPDSARPAPPLETAGEALSDWLARAMRYDLDWTVLVAGGDLVLGGELVCDGPLLLAAGGEIRSAPGARIEAPFTATVGRRPGLELRYYEDSHPQNAWRADLVLDPPGETNPLAAPLRLAVRSAPIPEVGGAGRWHPAPRVGGRPGAGSWRISYLGSPLSGGSRLGEQVVDDPAMLESSPTLRFEILFEIPSGGPGVPWDPPWIDSVQVRWDPLDPSSGKEAR